MNQISTPLQTSNEILNSKVGGQLTIAKRIGRGHLGNVYVGVHPVLARRFAIKVFRPMLTQDEDVKRRLRRLIREASTIEHPNVASLIDYGELENGSQYIAMEFVHGIQLSKMLNQEMRIAPTRALHILIQIADALEAAHRLRVVHGNVKPGNMILMEEPGRSEMLKLHDFSLTIALSEQSNEEDPLGHLRVYSNFEFIAPEQINNVRVDGRADIYSFGAIAYRMLTGEPPFVGDNEEMLIGHRTREPVPPSRRAGAHDIPTQLDAIILRCLEKNPSDRYKTMDEVSRELKALLPTATPEHFEEEITGRWKLPPELEQLEESLPESPARLRQLFYDSMLELAEAALAENLANKEVALVVQSLKETKDMVTSLAAQAAVTENRFEDIRRELRERESTLRYAIIDLNLAKADAKDRRADELTLQEIEKQISELELNLSELEQQRGERFAQLNVELQKSRDLLKAMEQKMAALYRQLYSLLDEIRSVFATELAIKLYRRLDRCRVEIARTTVRFPEA